MAAILVFSVFFVLKVNKNYVVFKDVLIKKEISIKLKINKKYYVLFKGMQNKVRIKKIKNDKIFKAEKSPATVFDFKLRSRFKFRFFTIMQNIFFYKKNYNNDVNLQTEFELVVLLLNYLQVW